MWGAALVGFWLRALPILIWGTQGCTFDECSYKTLATGIARGEGLLPHEGWLWAPGYPYVLALCAELVDVMRIKRLQVVLGVLTILLVYRLTQRVFDRRTARCAALLIALHPTLSFFAGTLWSESFYTLILVGAALSVLWARDGQWHRALLTGGLLALCVLFRGVATFMTPFFLLALVWPTEGPFVDALRRRWRHGIAALVAAFVLVAPYSAHISREHGGFLVADATIGQVMYMGNNDFPLPTYDYGNGLMNLKIIERYEAKGRAHCDEELPVAVWNRCEVAGGVRWIAANPVRFASRMPQRVAQLLNPNSFLTRHMRMGKWLGLPWWIKEVLSVLVILFSLAIILGGTAGAWARARGSYGALAVGVVVYHVAVISTLFGMSRFRVPLEPLWIVYLAALLADPGGSLEALRASRWRWIGCLVSLVVLTPLVLWYLPTGFPGWYR